MMVINDDTFKNDNNGNDDHSILIFQMIFFGESMKNLILAIFQERCEG